MQFHLLGVKIVAPCRSIHTATAQHELCRDYFLDHLQIPLNDRPSIFINSFQRFGSCKPLCLPENVRLAKFLQLVETMIERSRKIWRNLKEDEVERQIKGDTLPACKTFCTLDWSNQWLLNETGERPVSVEVGTFNGLDLDFKLRFAFILVTSNRFKISSNLSLLLTDVPLLLVFTLTNKIDNLECFSLYFKRKTTPYLYFQGSEDSIEFEQYYTVQIDREMVCQVFFVGVSIQYTVIPSPIIKKVSIPSLLPPARNRVTFLYCKSSRK